MKTTSPPTPMKKYVRHCSGESAAALATSPGPVGRERSPRRARDLQTSGPSGSGFSAGEVRGRRADRAFGAASCAERTRRSRPRVSAAPPVLIALSLAITSGLLGRRRRRPCRSSSCRRASGRRARPARPGPSRPACVTVFTTCGTKKTDTAMTMRITRPQTARPVAVSAGLRFSTVSVKLAIHGAYATPRNTASRLSDHRRTWCSSCPGASPASRR